MKSIYDIEDIDVSHLSLVITELIGKIQNTKLSQTLSQQLKSIKDSDVTSLEKYYTLLVFIDEKRQDPMRFTHQDVAKSMTILLKQSLNKFSETQYNNADESTDDEIKKSLSVLTKQMTWDKECFDSLAHQIFCKKWKVCGSFQDYNIWHQFTAELNKNLDQSHYSRIVTEFALAFGLETKSKIIDTSDPIYDQSCKSLIAEDEHKPCINARHELEIWTFENIVKLLMLYLQQYAHEVSHDITLIETKALEIRQQVLLPLFETYINQARNSAQLKDFDACDVKWQLAIYANKIQELKLEAVTPVVAMEEAIQLKSVSKPQEKLPSILKPEPTFVDQHPILLNTLKGMGIGLGAFGVVIGVGSFIYATGGAGAAAIAAIVKTVGVGGSMVGSAALTTLPGSVIGAIVGAKKPTQGNNQSETKQLKSVHFAEEEHSINEEKPDLTYNRYFQKFLKKNAKTIHGEAPSLTETKYLTPSIEEKKLDVVDNVESSEQDNNVFEFPSEFGLRH